MLLIDKNDKNAEQKELEFEVRWQMSLTIKQRFQLMFNRSLEILKRLQKNGFKKTPGITQRT